MFRDSKGFSWIRSQQKCVCKSGTTPTESSLDCISGIFTCQATTTTTETTATTSKTTCPETNRTILSLLTDTTAIFTNGRLI